MYKHFSADFFAGNRRRLRSLTGDANLIVVTANGVLQRTSDNVFAFRQDSNFWYLTGINDPDITLVMDGSQEYLIVPERAEIMEFFDGKTEHDTLQKVSGIKTILVGDAGWKKLSARLTKLKKVATLTAPPSFVVDQSFYTNPARARLIKRLKNANLSLEIVSLQEHFRTMRVIKQPQELSAIKQAIQITIDALKVIQKKTLDSENNYEASITASIINSGATGHAYTPVVAAGKNACTLHYVANRAKVAKDDLILFDVGAEVESYCADISRTYAHGKPTKRQQAVHDAVVAAQDYGFSIIKPGVTMRETETKMEQFIGKKLQELGLIKEPNHENIRKFYPHALSHFLGLDLHDAGDYTKPLEPGMVITVEPGIYIPEEGIGIRLEDDVLITDTGIENLCGSLPRELY